MLRGTIYFKPATEFSRMTFLVGSESGVIEEWAADIITTNTKCEILADVTLNNDPLRTKIDGKWEYVWLYDHVVRATGCRNIPEHILACVNDNTYRVKFIYVEDTLELTDLTDTDMTRIRHWFHEDIRVGINSYPLDPLHTLTLRYAQTPATKRSCPQACPCTLSPTPAETAQTAVVTPPRQVSDAVPTTDQKLIGTA